MDKSVGINDKPFRKILIATDGSKASENAARLGIKLAHQNGAKVYAIYVINLSAYDSILMDESWVKDECKECEEKGHKTTSSVEEKAKFTGLEVESVILKGNPAEKILDFANENNVDMIVLGRLGKSGIERFAIGNVSENVVRHAKVPVLIVQ